MSRPNVHAVLVAAEDFGLGKDWELDGPCEDVLSMSLWLTQMGVQPGHIRVLASPIAKNVDRMAQGLKALGLHDQPQGLPTSAVLDDLFKRKLLHALVGTPQGDGVLILYWAGHGIFDPDEYPPQRLVLCSDLAPHLLPAVPLDGLARWLRSQLPGFRIVFIVDACATQKALMNIQSRLDPANYPSVGLQGGAPFLSIFSCSEGESAVNVGKGLFTSEFLAQTSNFQPASASDFQRLEPAIRAARERVEQLTSGRQRPVRDLFEDWQGMREAGGSSSATSRRQASLLGLEAASYCDRGDQWGSFKQLAHGQVQALSNHVVLAVMHGAPNQSPEAFFKKLVHQIRHSKQDERGFHQCSAAAEEQLVLDLHGRVDARQVGAELRGALIRHLQIDPVPAGDNAQRDAISSRINDDRRAVVFTAAVRARLLGSNTTLLDDCRAFWASLPPIKAKSLAVFALFVSYDLTPPGVAHWLKSLWSRDRRVRALIEKHQCAVQPELGDVTRDHLYEWGRDMKALYPGWRQPTEAELNLICPVGQVRSMAEVVDGLEHMLREREKTHGA